MNKLSFLILTFIVFTSTANSETYNVLFVGNSLTYTNNLPDLVKQIAAEKGISLGTKMLAKPNYAIVDHWADGKVQKLIKSKKYDFVILQQGPSSQQNGYNMLINSGRQYKELCQANGCQLAYYMVWPSRHYYYTFEGVIANYTAAAKANDAILCPVGEVWKAHFDATGDYSYYGSDKFHPSLKGSQVAADVIVNSLFYTEQITHKFQQAWLTGLGQIENNNITVTEMYMTENGQFGTTFNSNEINNKLWGSLNIEFTSCHEGNMSYSSDIMINELPFGTGGYAIQRLALNKPGQQCDQLGFDQISDKSFFSGTYFGGSTRSGEGFNIDYLNENQAIVTWYTYLPKH